MGHMDHIDADGHESELEMLRHENASLRSMIAALERSSNDVDRITQRVFWERVFEAQRGPAYHRAEVADDALKEWRLRWTT